MRPGPLILFTCLAVLLGIPLAGAQNPTHQPGGFHSPDLHPRTSWTLTLTAPGTYYYHCHPHPFMQGVIEVTEDAAADEVAVNVIDYDFVPDRSSIRPGGRVNWTNTGNTLHTVDESIPPTSDEDAEAGKGIPTVSAMTLGLVVATAALLGRRRRRT